MTKSFHNCSDCKCQYVLNNELCGQEKEVGSEFCYEHSKRAYSKHQFTD